MQQLQRHPDPCQLTVHLNPVRLREHALPHPATGKQRQIHLALRFLRNVVPTEPELWPGRIRLSATLVLFSATCRSAIGGIASFCPKRFPSSPDSLDYFDDSLATAPVFPAPPTVRVASKSIMIHCQQNGISALFCHQPRDRRVEFGVFDEGSYSGGHLQENLTGAARSGSSRGFCYLTKYPSSAFQVGGNEAASLGRRRSPGLDD